MLERQNSAQSPQADRGGRAERLNQNVSTSFAGKVDGVSCVQIGLGATPFTRLPLSASAWESERDVHWAAFCWFLFQDHSRSLRKLCGPLDCLRLSERMSSLEFALRCVCESLQFQVTIVQEHRNPRRHSRLQRGTLHRSSAIQPARICRQDYRCR